ncbi:hypothetical protein KI387_019787, partial [Taxus chinensis]
VEGDVVSIIMDPVSSWPKLKGAQSKQQIRISDTNGNTITAESEDLSKARYRVDHLCKNGHTGQACNSNLDEESTNSHLDLEHTTLRTYNGMCANEAENGILGNGSSCHIVEQHLENSDSSEIRSCDDEQHKMEKALENVAMIVNSLPGRWPTGSLIGIIEKSPCCDAVIVFLEVKQWISCKGKSGVVPGVSISPRKNWNGLASHTREG